MGGHNHYIKQCSTCEDIIEQCRCFGPKKTQWLICEKCKGIKNESDVIDTALNDLFECQCKNRYNIEAHGKGYAIYWGRCRHRHGANLGLLTECRRKDIVEYFEKALNKEIC